MNSFTTRRFRLIETVQVRKNRFTAYNRFVHLKLLVLLIILLLGKIAAAQDGPKVELKVFNALNQLYFYWQADSQTQAIGYELLRSATSDQWQSVFHTTEITPEAAYIYYDTQVGKADKIDFCLITLTATDTIKAYYEGKLRPYAGRLSYEIKKDVATISFFGGFVDQTTTVVLIGEDGNKFHFEPTYTDDRISIHVPGLPAGKYTYSVRTGPQTKASILYYYPDFGLDMPDGIAIQNGRSKKN